MQTSPDNFWYYINGEYSFCNIIKLHWNAISCCSCWHLQIVYQDPVHHGRQDAHVWKVRALSNVLKHPMLHALLLFFSIFFTWSRLIPSLLPSMVTSAFQTHISQLFTVQVHLYHTTSQSISKLYLTKLRWSLLENIFFYNRNWQWLSVREKYHLYDKYPRESSLYWEIRVLFYLIVAWQ